MDRSTLEAAERAIHATREGLRAAGYRIDVGASAGRLSFSVRAEPDACEECLVPRAIFATILGRELQEAGIDAAGFELRYPLDDEGLPAAGAAR